MEIPGTEPLIGAPAIISALPYARTGIVDSTPSSLRMKSMISSDRLFDAFLEGGLGNADIYPWWTMLWGLRSQIWQKKSLIKESRNSLGEMTRTAIEEGNTELFLKLAGALDWIKQFERSAANAARADVFFSIEELNHSRPSFDRTDLLDWLNGELETCISAKELKRELDILKLSDLIPKSKKKSARKSSGSN